MLSCLKAYTMLKKVGIHDKAGEYQQDYPAVKNNVLSLRMKERSLTLGLLNNFYQSTRRPGEAFLKAGSVKKNNWRFETIIF